MTRTRWISIAVVGAVIAAATVAIVLLSKDDSEEAASGGFDQDNIEVTLTKGKFIQAFFVDESGRDLYEVARECAHALQEDGWESVNCYAYDSQEALDYSEPPERFGRGTAHTCWRAFFSLSTTGTQAGSETNEDYAAEGCPEA